MNRENYLPKMLENRRVKIMEELEQLCEEEFNLLTLPTDDVKL